MIDTHCHLTSRQFAGRADEIIANARNAGLSALITVSTTSADASENLAIARRHDDVYCTSGVHPLYADESIDWDTMRAVADDPRCVAWGELGLDRHYETPAIATQQRVLEDQLAHIEAWTAQGCSLPVVVHSRQSVDELLAVFRTSPLPADRFVFHCFTGGPDDARSILDFGAWISFTGVVTFHNAPEVGEAARIVPADRIMVETDAPYLTPAPHRKVRPNEPKFVVHVSEHIARLRGVDPGDFECTCDANARRFFGLPG